MGLQEEAFGQEQARPWSRLLAGGGGCLAGTGTKGPEALFQVVGGEAGRTGENAHAPPSGMFYPGTNFVFVMTGQGRAMAQSGLGSPREVPAKPGRARVRGPARSLQKTLGQRWRPFGQRSLRHYCRLCGARAAVDACKPVSMDAFQ